MRDANLFCLSIGLHSWPYDVPAQGQALLWIHWIWNWTARFRSWTPAGSFDSPANKFLGKFAQEDPMIMQMFPIINWISEPVGRQDLWRKHIPTNRRRIHMSWIKQVHQSWVLDKIAIDSHIATRHQITQGDNASLHNRHWRDSPDQDSALPTFLSGEPRIF